ncbi:MAG: D-alanine--D-alanine ligase family protein [Bacteroidota bacterium]
MSAKLLLLFGGMSPEHAISIRSARNIFSAINREKYQVQLVGIAQDGSWHAVSEADFLQEELIIGQPARPLCLVPGTDQPIRFLHETGELQKPDVVFPITHGPYGEDGSLQGILRHLQVPFVGPDVLGSAASMDKDICKRLLREADLLVADSFTFHHFEKDAIDFHAIVNRLGLPLFIKPANMGSSVGVSKVESHAEFTAAIHEAFRYDHKIIVEEGLVGRELECAVMGNGEIAATTVGEVITGPVHYDYESKYLSDDAAKVVIPAENIDDQMLAKLMLIAKNAYQVLGCEGLARVDMFLCEDGRVYINEVNTLPGFTSISMYPKLWEAVGTPYSELIDLLIDLALERGKREAKLEKKLNL